MFYPLHAALLLFQAWRRLRSIGLPDARVRHRSFAFGDCENETSRESKSRPKAAKTSANFWVIGEFQRIAASSANSRLDCSAIQSEITLRHP
jgi:hypothetical protein